jgi:hypothetical protein
MIGPMYNLPREHDAPLANFQELLQFLSGIASSDTSVRILVGRPPAEFAYFEARGKLRQDLARSKEDYGLFDINASGSRDEGGSLSIPEKHFRGGHLTTFDGDDYFTLVVELDGVVLHLQDTNSI